MIPAPSPEAVLIITATPMAAIIIATLITRLIIIRAREAVVVLLILLRMGMCIRSRAELGTFEGGGGEKIMGDELESVGSVSEVGRLTHVVDRFEIEIERFLSHLLRVKLAQVEQRARPFFMVVFWLIARLHERLLPSGGFQVAGSRLQKMHGSSILGNLFPGNSFLPSFPHFFDELGCSHRPPLS